MHNTFFCSDTHFGHKKCWDIHCPERKQKFESVEVMNVGMIEAWNKKIANNDDVYFLGDFCWYKRDVISILNSLNGRIHFVLGNHDENFKSKIKDSVWEMDRLILFKQADIRITMCHYPMLTWPSRRHNSLHLHGHCHGHSEKRFNVFDVGMDVIGYVPISLDEILEKAKNQDININEKEITL